jgi:7-cyano-7-deazaguanine synthase
MKEKAVVIVSGGMDSTTLLYDIIDRGYDVSVLSFNYNQKHKAELENARATCSLLGVPHKIADLALLNEIAPSALTREDWEVPTSHYQAENMKETVVPNRNMIMLALAAAYAIGVGATKLFYGAHNGDHAIYPDCRKEFIDVMKQAFLLCDWTKIELEAPYWDLDKGDILVIGKKLNVDYSKTWTCYDPKVSGDRVISCGKCGSCTERLDGFKKAEMIDPIPYVGD